jgi:AraC-like DNA-binding protein
MDQALAERWSRVLAGNAVVARLQRAAGELLGGALLVLLRRRDEVIEVEPPGGPGLPEFCSLYRANPSGLECCLSCRALMAFGACYRGTIEYSCHGGVTIIASVVPDTLRDDVQVVVASCAFSRENREVAWNELRDHAHGLGIDLRRMRGAYDRMPVLTDEHRRIATVLVEAAAAALGPAARTGDDAELPIPAPVNPGIDELIESALYVAQTQSAGAREPIGGSLLVERIRDLLHRHPEMPFTVKRISAAARVSPNYLSTLFRRATGMNFTDYLLRERVEYSQQLLRDLTLSIEQVAHRSGFGDAGYFTRRFRKATGMTPSQWRSSI